MRKMFYFIRLFVIRISVSQKLGKKDSLKFLNWREAKICKKVTKSSFALGVSPKLGKKILLTKVFLKRESIVIFYPFYNNSNHRLIEKTKSILLLTMLRFHPLIN